MTRIVFDKDGLPSWVNIEETGKFIHRISDFSKDATPPFSQSDLDWFKKPLTERSE